MTSRNGGGIAGVAAKQTAAFGGGGRGYGACVENYHIRGAIFRAGITQLTQVLFDLQAFIVIHLTTQRYNSISRHGNYLTPEASNERSGKRSVREILQDVQAKCRSFGKSPFATDTSC